MALVIPLDRPSSPPAARGSSPRRTTQAVHVVAWDDPEAPLGGIDVRSAYVERFWLPLLGAQATWLARRLADRLDAAPDGFDLEVDETVRLLGLWARAAHARRSVGPCCAAFAMGPPATIAPGCWLHGAACRRSRAATWSDCPSPCSPSTDGG